MNMYFCLEVLENGAWKSIDFWVPPEREAISVPLTTLTDYPVIPDTLDDLRRLTPIELHDLSPEVKNLVTDVYSLDTSADGRPPVRVTGDLLRNIVMAMSLPERCRLASNILQLYWASISMADRIRLVVLE